MVLVEPNLFGKIHPKSSMTGFRFSKFSGAPNQSPFQRLLDLFLQILPYTSGDISEALSWMNELDKEHQLTDDSYGMGDFIEDLYKQGYIKENEEQTRFKLTGKTEQLIRKKSLEVIFGKIKKSQKGNHRSVHRGQGEERTSELRDFEFGDQTDMIAITESMKNAQLNHGIDEFQLKESDLRVHVTEHQSRISTVLMIDISHSMILYGEDRITPAKNVAMALAELINTRYPKDTLDIIVFGNDAWQIELKELPYLHVGPYHTNTVAGLELAMDLLRRRRNSNKQIFMITDGKPTCLKQADGYYKNSFGLDRKILNRTLNLARQCRRLKIPVTTFMVAKDPYLQSFVREFTEVNNGRAFFASLQGLGEYIFEDFERNRRRTTK